MPILNLFRSGPDRLFVPAAIASSAGIGLDVMGNALSQAYPGAPHWLWLVIFWFGFSLLIALPSWGVWKLVATIRGVPLARGLQVTGVALGHDVLAGKKRNIQLSVAMENITDSFIRYAVSDIAVSLNGKSLPSAQFANRGAVIAPKRSTVFRYPRFESVVLPKEAQALVSVAIECGPSEGRAMRRVKRGFDCTVRAYSNPPTIVWTNTEDEDEAI